MDRKMERDIEREREKGERERELRVITNVNWKALG